MKTFKQVIIILNVLASSISLCQSHLSNSNEEQITSFIKNTMKEIEIPGASVAILKDDKVIYRNNFGKANLEYNIPVTDSSLFRLHSLSKLFISVGVFQLIEQKKILLDDKISMYLDDLPDSWKNIKIKNLLSHSSGLPDMREETNPSEDVAKKNVYSKNIQFPTGERASYNQTNFWLLNRIIRKLNDDGFQSHITQQFGDKSKVRFSNVADIIPNRVMEYKPNVNGELKNYHFIVQEYMYGCGGITMSLDNLIDWDKKLNNNILLNAASKKEMLTSFKYNTNTGIRFTYGWDIQSLNGIISYGFNGAGLVNYRKFPSKNLSVIWFTNGYRKPHNIDNITNKLVGLVDNDLVDKTPEFAESLYKIVKSDKPSKVAKEYYYLKTQYPYVNFERVINGLGYKFLGDKDVSNAITLFKLNTKEFPTSINVYDSLGEAYFINKQYDLSLVNYEKVLGMDGTNQNAKKMISKIENVNKN